MTARRTVLRPRATLLVCVGLAVALVAGAVALVLALERADSLRGGDAAAIASVVGLALVVCALMGRVRVVLDDDGVTVRNPVRTHRLEWAEIVAVRLGRDRPWVELDLADGVTLAAMGVQASDGARAHAQARLLREAVAAHEGVEPPPDAGRPPDGGPSPDAGPSPDGGASPDADSSRPRDEPG